MKQRRALLLGTLLAATPGVALAQPPPPAALPTAPSQPPTANQIELSMTVGENRTISAQDVTSYSVGTPGFVDVKLNPDKTLFVLVALRPGHTTVLMLKPNGTQVTYTITVFERDPEAVRTEVAELIRGYTGLRLKQVGRRFFIEGGVGTDADVRRIERIASLFPGQVESLVVQGSVGIEHTINIRIDFYFVQYDKSSSYGVGVAWPARYGGGQLTVAHDLVSNVTSANMTAEQLLPSLDLAQTRGWAKVLKHSTVITTSGSEATFTNGGEQNFPVATGLTSTIQPIKFGTNMTVLPRFDVTSRDLEVKINANVADLTPPAGTTSLPGRQTSELATFVHLKLGQSIVLSGIRSSSQTKSASGLPGLSQIPILGALFGSNTGSSNDIEGAVFIIPSIVESVPRKAHNIVEFAMKQYADYSGDIDNAAAFSHAPPHFQ